MVGKMQKIKIINLGALHDVEFDIKQFNFFIGEQAVGKSTLCKAIYFCRLLKHNIIDALYKDVYNMKFNWTDNIDVDLNTIYDNINAKYKEKFNRLTMVNYIRAELKKYDLRDFNLDFVIMTVDSILRNKDKV